MEYYIKNLRTKIGNLNILFCVDGGGPTMDRFWINTSLRGYIEGTLKIKVL